MTSETQGARQAEAALVAAEIAGHLEAAWNAADGAAFAAPFADDADFVDVRGAHHRGKAAVAAGHSALFASLYRGSTARYHVSAARPLADGVILVHATGDLEVPAGPAAGTHRATPSFVVVRGGQGWQIASFHNTPVLAPPPETAAPNADPTVVSSAV
jgi:uncharacterized protein (TIGR02246 family)